jgi:serine/threonine-protein phosphatase PGAM5
MTTMLYLVRHAEQELTPDEDPAAGISAVGQDQARLLGQRLRGVPLDGIHHGPATRARETAYVVAESLPGVAVRESELLDDRTPMPEPGLEIAYSEAELAWLTNVPISERDPGGARITSAIEYFGSLGEGQHVLITHAFVIGWFVRSALGSPTNSWMGLNPFNAGLTVIRHRPDHPDQPVSLISYNDLGHLPVEVRGRTPVALSI